MAKKINVQKIYSTIGYIFENATKQHASMQLF